MVDFSKSSEVEIICKGKSFFVDKNLLSKQSLYFEAMFVGNFKETNQKVIHIKDTRKKDLQFVLEYIYTKKINSQNTDFSFLEEIANFYQIQKLSNKLKHIHGIDTNLTIAEYVKKISDLDTPEKTKYTIKKEMKAFTKKCIRMCLKTKNAELYNQIIWKCPGETFNMPCHLVLKYVKTKPHEHVDIVFFKSLRIVDVNYRYKIFKKYKQCDVCRERLSEDELHSSDDGFLY